MSDSISPIQNRPATQEIINAAKIAAKNPVDEAAAIALLQETRGTLAVAIPPAFIVTLGQVQPLLGLYNPDGTLTSQVPGAADALVQQSGITDAVASAVPEQVLLGAGPDGLVDYGAAAQAVNPPPPLGQAAVASLPDATVAPTGSGAPQLAAGSSGGARPALPLPHDPPLARIASPIGEVPAASASQVAPLAARAPIAAQTVVPNLQLPSIDTPSSNSLPIFAAAFVPPGLLPILSPVTAPITTDPASADPAGVRPVDKITALKRVEPIGDDNAVPGQRATPDGHGSRNRHRTIAKTVPPSEGDAGMTPGAE